MRKKIKMLVSNNYWMYKFARLTDAIIHSRGLKIKTWGGVKLDVFNLGKNNRFIAGRDCLFDKVSVRIRGNNNTITFENNVKMGKHCEILINGNNCQIYVGENCTFTSFNALEVNEDNQKIKIGENCMFSNHIHIRTGDSHAIYDLQTHLRINPARSVSIGSDVWIAAGVTILKGVEIGSGSVVGKGSIVTHNIPNNVIAVGIPAKVVKSGICWSKELGV